MTDGVPSGPLEPRPTLGASELAAGGGAGGALLFAINSFVPNPTLKTLLTYLAPTISIVFMGVYSFATDWAADGWKSFEAERTRKKLLRRAKEGLAEAKAQLSAIEADPAATAEHKVTARDRVQKFERAVLDLNAKGIVVID